MLRPEGAISQLPAGQEVGLAYMTRRGGLGGWRTFPVGCGETHKTPERPRTSARMQSSLWKLIWLKPNTTQPKSPNSTHLPDQSRSQSIKPPAQWTCSRKKWKLHAGTFADLGRSWQSLKPGSESRFLPRSRKCRLPSLMAVTKSNTSYPSSRILTFPVRSRDPPSNHTVILTYIPRCNG